MRIASLLLLVAWRTDSAGSCSFFSKAGIDYNDPSLKVLTGAPARNGQACCNACAAYNAQNGAPACVIGVWHNLGEGSKCDLKSSASQPVRGHYVRAYAPARPKKAFRFGNAQSSGMVLQSAPQRSNVWGVCSKGDKVSVSLNGKKVPVSYSSSGPSTVWTASLPATEASLSRKHTIVAKSSTTSPPGNVLTLNNVLFGDVWVCSGQSNMAYGLSGSNGQKVVHPPVDNHDVEVNDMRNFPQIRLLRPGHNPQPHASLDLADTEAGGATAAVQGWTEPCPSANGGKCREDFSSVCWFFGRNLALTLKPPRPIGLIGSYFGGTKDEYWSSADALKECGLVAGQDAHAPAAIETNGKKQHSISNAALWNGQIHPLVKSTIKGVVWYQGESNARKPGGQGGYDCTFPAMIKDWRKKWFQGTGGRTEKEFPFGFVQLNSNGKAVTYNNPHEGTEGNPLKGGFPGVRWAQTAGYGYAPNPKLPRVFMAVSYDTPDVPNGDKDPGYNVHSPYKQPTAARLTRSALAIAYGVDVGTYTPYWASATRTATDQVTLTVLSLGGASGPALGLKVRAVHGFEVLVPTSQGGRRLASSGEELEVFRVVNIRWGKGEEKQCKWQCSCKPTQKGCGGQGKCVDYIWTADTRMCQLLGPKTGAGTGTATGHAGHGGVWKSVAIVASTTNTVTVGGVPDSATKIRYNWYSNPCGKDLFGCAVYARVKVLGTFSGARPELPMPPFMGKIDTVHLTTAFGFPNGNSGVVVVHG